MGAAKPAREAGNITAPECTKPVTSAFVVIINAPQIDVIGAEAGITPNCVKGDSVWFGGTFGLDLRSAGVMKVGFSEVGNSSAGDWR